MSNLYLVTMPPSHFCEKARWALDLQPRPYVEERFAPPFHRAALKKINAGYTVPALMVNKKDTFPDSNSILKWVDKQLPERQKLFATDPVNGPMVIDFCQRCDAKLAPEVLTFVHTFMPRPLFTDLMTAGVPADQAQKFRWMSPFIQFMFKHKHKMNPANFNQSVRRILKFFDDVDHLIHGGKNFLYCERFGAADITFCALAAPALFIAEYGGSKFPLENMPSNVQDEVKKLREHPAGKFAMSIYRDCRRLKLG